MNKQRRKEIQDVIDGIGKANDAREAVFLQIADAIAPFLSKLEDVKELYEKLRDNVDDLKSEEEEAHGNLPEAMQDGDKGTAMQESIDALQEAYDSMDEAVTAVEGMITGFNYDDLDLSEIDDPLETAIGQLETAQGN